MRACLCVTSDVVPDSLQGHLFHVLTYFRYRFGSIQLHAPLHLFPKRNLTRTFDQSRILLQVRVFILNRIPFYQIPCNTKYFQPPFISNNAVARGTKGLPHSSLYSRYNLSYSLSLSPLFFPSPSTPQQATDTKCRVISPLLCRKCSLCPNPFWKQRNICIITYSQPKIVNSC